MSAAFVMNEIISSSADDPLLPVCRILHTDRNNQETMSYV
ncbi:hypothetical protein RDI58_015297 [Solanum bulbocastanum]|uniref:Uncharacterized protein n=1 Tax=Solanum bulbocastanum TaxID=147425 RepID=A0AAN8TKN4_SOLBU